MDFSRRRFLEATCGGAAALPGALLPGALLARDLAEQTPLRILQAEPAPGRRAGPVVTCLSMQPGGDLLAVGGDDHLLRIWNVRTGRLLRALPGHEDWIRAVLFVPGKSEIVTAGDDRQVLDWTIGEDVITPRRIARREQAIAALAISPDGTQLAAAGFESRLGVYDAQSGELAARLVCPCRDMRAAAFSPDGRLLAAAGRNGRLRIWNVANWRPARDVQAHRRRVRALAFSPAGEELASAGEDRTVRIWDPATGELKSELATGAAKILSAAYVDADHLATGGSDNAIRIWDVRAGRQVELLAGHTGSVAALDVDRDRLISGSFDTTVRIWHPLRHAGRAAVRLHPPGAPESR